ncbi:MmgE/PrpD family protein [Craurococcus roseus]|uniref:MmgE/PrpD family protein n=1 Tax=Craurococcus roseus TaxID=77585 RepID=A0ABP3R5N4_9PROT
MTTPTDALAAHIAGVSAATVPEAVRDRAGLVLADTLGVIVAGQGDPAVAATARRHATGGPCRLPGTAALRAAPPMAAFLNGFAGTALELDEGNYPAGGHPGVHAVAAALAEAEARQASGAALLDAVIAGYEAGARVGMATRLRPAAHPHGTWGTLGAAAAVARLRGHDAATVRRVLEVAASLGLATSATASLRGGSVRNAYAGAAAQNGMLACDLAEAGVTGEPGGIAAVFGGVVGEGFDEGAMVAGLGERWLIPEAFFKQASCCRETQGALEAIELLLAEAPVAPGDVAAVEVETFASAAALSERAPAAPIAGRFSIPFTVATRIVSGHAWTDAFSEKAVADPKTQGLAARVAVREAPELSARLPAERVCRLTLRLRDGAVRQREVVGTPGDPDRPLPEEALREKFRRCAEPALGLRWEGAWRAARRLDALADLSALF